MDETEAQAQALDDLELWREAKPTRWYWIDSPGSNGSKSEQFQVNLADDENDLIDVVRGEYRGQTLAKAAYHAIQALRRAGQFPPGKENAKWK